MNNSKNIDSNKKIHIDLFSESHITLLVQAFDAQNWIKSEKLFENYLKEQYSNERLIWVAYYDNQMAGYVTLKWNSQYTPFNENNIPEIKDLNVLPSFRNKNVGTKLMVTAENAAFQKADIVGIGVGLYDGYGAAQKLYINRGYLPDGKGITSHYKKINYGENVILDDDLILWLTKKIG